MTRAVDDPAVGAKDSDHLLRISVEGEDAQRHAVVEQTEAAAKGGLLICERGPRQSNPRGYTNSIGDALPLEAGPDVHREPLSDNPVILAEECGLEIGAIEPVPSDPINSFDQMSGGILD